MEKDEWGCLVLGGIGAVFAFATYASIQYFNKKSKQYKHIVNSIPIDINEYKSLDMKPGDFAVLRVMHELKNPQSQKQTFYSNQEYFGYPDQRQYVTFKLFEQENALDDKVWRGHDVYDYQNTMKFKGLGNVLNGVLEVDVEAVKTIAFKDQPFYKKIFIVLTFGFDYILSVLYAIFGGKILSSVTFKGVKVGEFNINYNWFKGHVLVQCEVNNDYIPEVQATGLSNDLLINNAVQRRSNAFKLMVLCTGICLISLYHFFKSYRKIREKERKKVELEPFAYRELQFEATQQIHTCIICMINNRNIIFSNCCHMMICSSCLPLYDNNNGCPYCKAVINVKKVYALK